MRSVPTAMLVVLCLLPAAPVTMIGQGTAELLQGTWTVTGGEHEGEPLDVIVGGTMRITNLGFEIETASANRLTGELRLDPATNPRQMDLVHADGTTWRGIYEVDGNAFRLIYVETDEPRPTAFATSPATQASLVTLVRAQP